MTTERRTIIAGIGYGLVCLMAVIFAVVLAEYDKDGHFAQTQGAILHGKLEFHAEVPHLRTEEGEVYEILRFREGQLQEGDSLWGNTLPGTMTMIPDFARPHRPQGTFALGLSLLGLLGAMVLVSARPSIAYLDILHHDV